MLNLYQSFSLAGLQIDLENFKAKVPDIGMTLRILLDSRTSLKLYEYSAPLEDLSGTTHHGRQVAIECDACLWEAACHRQAGFEYHCHTGLVKYVRPIISESHCVGVVVSGGFRPDDFEEKLEEAADRLHLTVDEIRRVIPYIPTVSSEFYRYSGQLIRATTNQLLSELREAKERNFLSDALAQRDLDTLLDLIAEKTPSLIWNTPCSVFLWDEQETKFILKKTNSTSLQGKVNHDGYLRGEGLTGWVGKWGCPLLVHDVRDQVELKRCADAAGISEEPKWSGKMLEGEIGPTMIVPIQAYAKSPAIGIIRLSPQIGEAFEMPTPRHIELFSEISKLIYGVIDSAQVMDSLRKMAMEVGNFNVDESIHILLNHSSKVFRSFSTHIRVKDKIRDLWYILAISDSPYKDPILRQGATHQRLIQGILDGREDHHLNNEVQSDSDLKERIEATIHDSEYIAYLKQIGAALIFPLRINGEIIGMVNMHRRPGETFEDYDVDLLRDLSKILEKMVFAISVADQKKGEDAALHGIDIRGEAVLEVDQLWDRIMQNALEVAGGQLVLVREVDNVNNRLKLARFKTKEGCTFAGKIPEYITIGEGCSGRATQEGKAYFIHDLKNDETYREERRKANMSLTGENVQFLDWISSEIAVPMKVSNSFQEVLVVLNSTPAKLFTSRDVDTMQALADRTALVLEYARLGTRLGEREAWTTMAADASHRVGNHLYSLCNVVEMLRLRLDKYPEVQDIAANLLPQVYKNIENARELLREFRLFSKPRPFTLRLMDLNDVIKDAVRESAFAKAEVQLVLDEQLPPFWFDANQIKDCFTELIQNAQEMGAKELSITTHFFMAQNSIQIIVSDNGKGLEMNRDPFKPLYTTKKLGTGLGLSMMKQTVERHRGTINAGNNPTGGANFVLHFPILSKEELGHEG